MIFLEVYALTPVSKRSHEFLASVDGLLKASGMPDAGSFYEDLEAEIFENIRDFGEGSGLPDAAERLWTSTQQNSRGQEFCQILNAATRPGASNESLRHACVLARCLNRNLVSRVPRARHVFPPHGRCLRGGGLPDVHRAFFSVGKTFRSPSYLATAFENATEPLAQEDPIHPHKFFLRRAVDAGHPGVRWEILLDERGDPQHPEYSDAHACKHVNFIQKRVPGLPDEQEFLFAAYSVFTVLSVHESETPHADDPHVIVLQAAIDNTSYPCNLPIAPWG